MLMSWIDTLPAMSSGWHSFSATPLAKLDVFVCRGQAQAPLAVVTAGVHGDEYEGPAAIIDLTRASSA